jgi:hypothetical protein
MQIWYIPSRELQPHYRPWQTLRFPGGWGAQILRQSAHEGGKVVSPTHRPPLPPENIPVFISVRGWFDPRAIVRPEGLCQWKNPVTLSGIEPATLQFVVQCLNHYATAYPTFKEITQRYATLLRKSHDQQRALLQSPDHLQFTTRVNQRFYFSLFIVCSNKEEFLTLPWTRRKGVIINAEFKRIWLTEEFT